MGLSATYNSNMYEEQFNALKNKIIRDLKSAYYELYLVQRKIEINKENQELLKQFIEIATKQYEVGMGKQPDIIRAQTELSSLINDEVNLYKEKRDVETMLNTILNRPPYQPFNKIESIYEDVPQFEYQKLLPLALEYRPELKGMKFNIEMYKSELRASKLEFYPDIMVKVMYKNMVDTKNDFWSAMVGVNVPIAFWSKDKYSGKVKENQLNIKTAEEQFNAMKNMISYEVQNAIVKLETNRNLYNLNKNTVIPQAEQTLQSTLAAYKTGKTEFLMLIDAYRMLFMAKLDFYMSEMNLMLAKAQLEQAVGLSINQIIEKYK
jgi:outer membrane protein TolC